jgi:hypothetical protein
MVNQQVNFSWLIGVLEYYCSSISPFYLLISYFDFMRWIRSVGVFISFCGVRAGMFLIQSTVVKLIFTFRSYHFTDVQTVLKAVEFMAFNFGKQLSDIRADVRVESLIVKPSEACKSNPENIAVFSRLLECLHLEYNHDLSLAAVEGECCADCPWANHVHNWTAARNAAKLPADADKPDTSLESSSYEPLVEYLKSVAHQNALAVRNGAGLPNGLLFDMFVYSLKSDVRLRSKVLRMTADEPRAKFHIMGRTDVVVLHPSSVSATRQTTCTAIEVKPEGFNVKEALREAFLQLIGLNIANEIRSPCVILTNLAMAHYVMYLQCVDPIKLRFKLVIKQYKSFNQALWMAMSLADRECITKHFGAAPTAQSSAADSASENENELTEEFDNVHVEGVER